MGQAKGNRHAGVICTTREKNSMSDRRLLLVFAHPDDESFGMGGTIAKYVAQGVDVYYLCATNGDVGTIPDEMKGAYPTIKELRLAELDCASKKLGFKQVFL